MTIPINTTLFKSIPINFPFITTHDPSSSIEVANVPAASSSSTARAPTATPRSTASAFTPHALRDLIPGRGSIRGVYLKRIESSSLYQGFYPSILSSLIVSNNGTALAGIGFT